MDLKLKNNESLRNKMENKQKVSNIIAKTLYWILFLSLIVYCISLLLPLIWLVLTSFKSTEEYVLDVFGLPKEFRWKNYLEVFEEFKLPYLKDGRRVLYGLVPMFFWSLVYTFSSNAFGLLLTVMCAYVLSSFDFRGKNFIFNVGIVVMTIPLVGTGLTSMILKKNLGIHDNMLLFILTGPSTAFSGFHFMILYGAFKGVSRTYREAVYIDGGGNYVAFFRIVLPMIMPTVTALFIMCIAGAWLDYNTFLIWLPSYPNIGVGIFSFESQATKLGVSAPVVMASFVVVIIPTIIIYILSQNVILSKFTIGGLKG